MKVIDARHIGLERNDHQIAHQLGVLFESVSGMPTGRSITGNLHSGALLFGLLNASLDVADAFEIFVELAFVARSQARLQAGHVAAHDSRECVRSCFMRFMRAAGSVDSPSPKRRSNRPRGLISIGLGVVGPRQEMVLV